MTSRRKKLSLTALIVVAIGIAGFFILTSPWLWSLTHSIPPVASEDGPIDIENGRRIFVASDCATCHATEGQDNDELLGGGHALDSEFGRFYMPNVSPHPEHGIGKWSLAEFDRAIRQGVGPSKILPDGQNLYPAFPYTSYVRLKPEDVRDMYAYMMTLPEVDNVVPEHELKFPYNIRRGVGVWRLVFLDDKSVDEIGVSTASLPADVDIEKFKVGRYLVESAAHCVECHSPRGFIGNIPNELRYAGGPDPAGINYFPNITPDETGIAYWSEASMANYLRNGVSPIGLTAGGDMADVILNTSQLDQYDLEAMATYLAHLPAINRPAPGMPAPNFSTEVVMLDNATDRRVSLPTSKPSDIKKGNEAFVAGTKSLFLSADTQNSHEEGKLLGGAAVKVLDQDKDMLQLQISGWQPVEAPSVIYQEMGQRVMMAALGDGAVAAAQLGDAQIDPNTEQEWQPITVTLWSDAQNLNLDQDVLWAFSREAYRNSCSSCHSMPKEEDYSANQWIGTMRSMERFIAFSDDEYRLILSYLQNHSADLGPRAIAQHSSAGAN